MSAETETEGKLPEGYRWDDLVAKDGIEQLEFYRALLLKLGSKDAKATVAGDLCQLPRRHLKQPRVLKKLVTSIDELDWYSAKEEGLGDLYEGVIREKRHREEVGGGPILYASAFD